MAALEISQISGVLRVLVQTFTDFLHARNDSAGVHIVVLTAEAHQSIDPKGVGSQYLGRMGLFARLGQGLKNRIAAAVGPDNFPRATRPFVGALLTVTPS
jgi:hypothetical protein